MWVVVRHDQLLLERLAERNLRPVTEQQGRDLQKLINAREYFEVTTAEIEVLNLLATEIVREALGKPTTTSRSKKKKKKKEKGKKEKGKKEKSDDDDNNKSKRPCLVC